LKFITIAAIKKYIAYIPENPKNNKTHEKIGLERLMKSMLGQIT
jgi:hypothetical protein